MNKFTVKILVITVFSLTIALLSRKVLEMSISCVQTVDIDNSVSPDFLISNNNFGIKVSQNRVKITVIISKMNTFNEVFIDKLRKAVSPRRGAVD